MSTIVLSSFHVFRRLYDRSPRARLERALRRTTKYLQKVASQ